MNEAVRHWRQRFLRGPMLAFGQPFMRAAMPPQIKPGEALAHLIVSCGGGPLDNLAVDARDWRSYCESQTRRARGVAR
jgi:hypothetical protein